MKNTIKIIVMTFIVSVSGFSSPTFSLNSSFCERGGKGATECSYTFYSSRWWGLWTIETTHSVSCGEGTYACCTKSGAGCVFNSPTIIQN